MPDTNRANREQLERLLLDCERCSHSFNDNVALIADEETGQLTDRQIRLVLESMNWDHEHLHVH